VPPSDSELVRRAERLDAKASGEPVLNRAAATAIVAVVCGLVALFATPIPQGVQDASVTVLLFAAPLAAGLWARTAAWSPRSVARLRAQLAAGRANTDDGFVAGTATVTHPGRAAKRPLRREVPPDEEEGPGRPGRLV
jgi:hypothetical protein